MGIHLTSVDRTVDVRGNSGMISDFRDAIGSSGLGAEEIMLLEGGYLGSVEDAVLATGRCEASGLGLGQVETMSPSERRAGLYALVKKRRAAVSSSNASRNDGVDRVKKLDKVISTVLQSKLQAAQEGGNRAEAARLSAKIDRLRASRDVALATSVRYAKTEAVGTLLSRSASMQIKLLDLWEKAKRNAKGKNNASARAAKTLATAFNEVGQNTSRLIRLRERQIAKWQGQTAAGRYVIAAAVHEEAKQDLNAAKAGTRGLVGQAAQQARANVARAEDRVAQTSQIARAEQARAAKVSGSSSLKREAAGLGSIEFAALAASLGALGEEPRRGSGGSSGGEGTQVSRDGTTLVNVAIPGQGEKVESRTGADAGEKIYSITIGSVKYKSAEPVQVGSTFKVFGSAFLPDRNNMTTTNAFPVIEGTAPAAVRQAIQDGMRRMKLRWGMKQILNRDLLKMMFNSKYGPIAKAKLDGKDVVILLTGISGNAVTFRLDTPRKEFDPAGDVGRFLSSVTTWIIEVVVEIVEEIAEAAKKIVEDTLCTIANNPSVCSAAGTAAGGGMPGAVAGEVTCEQIGKAAGCDDGKASAPVVEETEEGFKIGPIAVGIGVAGVAGGLLWFALR